MTEPYNPDDDWRADAACKGSTRIFYRPYLRRGENLANQWSPLPAKQICATCPVARQCLDYAVETREHHGIWGGAGDDILRGLRRIRAAAASHTGQPDCECGYCQAATEHLTRLRELAVTENSRPRRAPHRNGRGVTHGRASTYARGCRCARCKFRVSAAGVRLHDAGVDVPDWWTRRFGIRHGCSEQPATTARQCAFARQVVIIETADQITTALHTAGHDQRWLADQLTGVCDPDIARQLCDRTDTAHLISPTELATITGLLDVNPAQLLIGAEAEAA